MAEKKEKIPPKHLSLKVLWEERKRVNAIKSKLLDMSGGRDVTQTDIIKYLLDKEEEALALRRLLKTSDSISAYSTPALVELVNAMEGNLASLSEVIHIVASTIRACRGYDAKGVGESGGEHPKVETIKRA